MINPNKLTETEPKHKPMLSFKNCSYTCGHHCVQMSYTSQHQGPSNGGYIGIYTLPKSVTENYFVQ